MQLADAGWQEAMRRNPEIRFGANVVVVAGKVVCPGFAEAFGVPFEDVEQFI